MSSGVGRWMAMGRIGASSSALAAAALGTVPEGPPDYPHDSDDFSRCLTLYAMAPEAKDGLQRLAAISGQWNRLTGHWDELIALFGKDRRACTDRIYELTNPKKLRAYEYRKGDDGRWDIFPWSDRTRTHTSAPGSGAA